MEIEEAKKIALDYLKTKLGPKYEKIDIVNGESRLVEQGWIFFYQTKAYLQSHKKRDALIGNGPILVDKMTRRVIIFGSSGTIEYYCQLYAEGRTREGDDGALHLCALRPPTICTSMP